MQGSNISVWYPSQLYKWSRWLRFMSLCCCGALFLSCDKRAVVLQVNYRPVTTYTRVDVMQCALMRYCCQLTCARRGGDNSWRPSCDAHWTKMRRCTCCRSAKLTPRAQTRNKNRDLLRRWPVSLVSARARFAIQPRAYKASPTVVGSNCCAP